MMVRDGGPLILRHPQVHPRRHLVRRVLPPVRQRPAPVRLQPVQAQQRQYNVTNLYLSIWQKRYITQRVKEPI